VALLSSSSLLLAQDSVQVDTEAARKMVITATGLPPQVPVFYTTAVLSKAHIDAAKVKQTVELSLQVVQGDAEVLSIGMNGPTEGIVLQGEGISAWSIRHEGEEKFLDLEIKEGVEKLQCTLKQEVERERSDIELLSFAPAAATGFQQRLDITWRQGASVRLIEAQGCTPLEVGNSKKLAMYSQGSSRVRVEYQQEGSAFSDVVFEDLAITSSIHEDAKSATVRLRGTANVRQDDAEVDLVAGELALVEFSENKGFSFEVEGLGRASKNTRYGLKFEKSGSYPIDLEFSVALRETNGWKDLAFQLPKVAVMPVRVSGVPTGSRVAMGNVEAAEASSGGAIDAYLPANGQFSFRWKPQRKEAASKLFFASEAVSDVTVGAGMLYSETRLTFNVLQGKMRSLQLNLDGPGDIVELHGNNVASWGVKELEQQRVLDIVLNDERDRLDPITIKAQHPLGAFPVKVEPMRMTPVGAMRHAGYVRLSNKGAVKLGVTMTEGMMQLSPKQFPLPAKKEGATQTFVYRFPSADRSWELSADQILPEVSVNEMLVYALSETDRELRADIELDIREAPLREWEMLIPAEYAVASLTTAELGQMVVGQAVQEGMRTLTVNFKKEVIGRQLIQVRLARNAVTEEGEWELMKVQHPNARSVRGQLGIESALGWRVVAGEVAELTEMPLAYFPHKSTQLQQAFRIRDAKWQAKMQIEALEQSVSADVFHLYSLKEGMLYGSVLVNYFVIGAPMHEWKIEVPQLGEKGGIGNVIVEGQNVRSWRQDGELLTVTLHQPAMGGSTLLVSFEQPMSARGGEIQLGTVRPTDATNESGFIQVVSPTQVKKSMKVESGVLKLGATELPVEYRLMSSAPSLAAWQYATRGFDLRMAVEWFKPSTTVDQVVDFAELSTQVSRDGGVVTEAQFFVKTRGRRALEMSLPEGSKLLEASADGQSLNARKDGEKYLLPLPAKADPNAPVEVQLRYGATAENPKHVLVGVPVLSAPVVIGEWEIKADTGHLLDVVGGNVHPAEPNLTENGFEWVLDHSWILWIVVIGTLIGLLLGKCKGALSVIAFLSMGAAIFVSLVSANFAYEDRRVNQQSFEVVAPVISPENEVQLELSNLPRKAALSSRGWTTVLFLGVGLGLASFFVDVLRSSAVRAAAMAIVGIGLLGQLGGAVGLYLLFALLNGLAALLLTRQWTKERKSKTPSGPAMGATTAVLAFLSFFSTDLEAASIADSIKQTWEIQDEHLKARAEVYWKAKAGDSIEILASPASLTSCAVDGAELNKFTERGQTKWSLVASKDVVVKGTFAYEMSMQGLADQTWQLPTGDSVARSLRVLVDKEGWEVKSKQSVKTKQLEGLTEGRSGAELVFVPVRPVMLQFKPKGRDPKSEDLRFSVESADLYAPAPGVVNAWHGLRLRMISGEMSELQIAVPQGMMVGEVSGSLVEDWFYDPEKAQLRINFTKACSSQCSFMIKTQRGLEKLPQQLELEPMQVADASSVVGVFAIAFGNDAQPDALQTKGMSVATLSDFDGEFVKASARSLGQPMVLNKVYRYGVEEASLSLQVNPVAAELRAQMKQVLSLSEERLLLSLNAEVEILRSGVFELKFQVPENLEVESVSGAAMRDWVLRDGELVLQLNGKTQGTQKVHLTFTADSPVAEGDNGEWVVPQVTLVGALRQTGELLVVPEQGIQVRAIDRKHVTQQDARQSGSHRKGDLAFKLLQADWQLKLGVEKLDPWVRAQLLQEVSYREGQTRNRLSFLYEVENAAVKALRVRLPKLSESEMRTVRASGAAVKEMVHIEAEQWEVRLRRGVIGKIPFEVEFQENVDTRSGDEVVQAVLLDGVRQLKHYVAVRTSGRLDMRSSSVQGWRQSDWSAVPKRLKNKANSSVPALCYVVSEPENKLTVRMKRHEVADTLKLRVLHGNLTTLFGTDGASITLSEMKVRVVEKGSMRAILPQGAELFNVTVNGESVEIVSEGDAHLFYVTAGADDAEHAEVNMLYRTEPAEKVSSKIQLVGPQLNVPMAQMNWYVSLPEGYQLTGRGGGFDLVEAGFDKKSYGVMDYRSRISEKKAEQAEQARVQLDKANEWIAEGDFKKAEKVLSQVSKNRAVDAASNEDARVQLRNLRNQQAIMGLNTRRQKLYLDNVAQGNAIDQNIAFEEAANNNPLFQGKDNYHPAQVEQMLMGNSEEEREAMQKIADRMVSQQLAAQPAPQMIEVDLPESSKVLHFRRMSQLGANTPMVLHLEIENPSVYSWVGVLKMFVLLFAVCLAAVFYFKRA
jgi:hypothetical protein